MEKMDIQNDDGLEFMDIREEYIEQDNPTIIKLLPKIRVEPKPRQQTVELGEFEQRLMETISQLEAEEESESSPVTRVTNSPLVSSITTEQPTPLLSPITDTLDMSAPPIHHSESNQSLASLSKHKSVSFSQTLHVDSFSKYSSPSTPTSKSTELLAKSPVTKLPRTPFIVNGSGDQASDSDTDTDSQSSDDSDSDFTYESTDDPRYRYNPDHAPNGSSLPAVLNQVVEHDIPETNNDEMHDYLTVNQMQKEYYQKREMFIRHQMVKKGVEADGYEDMQWVNAFDGETDYDGMTFKPQDVKIKYAEGAIDDDIINYARENKEDSPEPMTAPPKDVTPIPPPHARKPMSKFMAMRQSNNKVIE